MSIPDTMTPAEESELFAFVTAKLAEEERNAPHCRCGWRCDPPHGNGIKCLSCWTRPTGEDMRIVITEGCVMLAASRGKP